jgi:hypothetical protein
LTGSLSTCEHGARVHDSERSRHQLKLSPRYRQPLSNDFDQVELDGIRVPSAPRKECAEAKRREDVVHVVEFEPEQQILRHISGRQSSFKEIA